MEMLFKKIEANNVAFVILNSSNRWLGIALVRFHFTDNQSYVIEKSAAELLMASRNSFSSDFESLHLNCMSVDNVTDNIGVAIVVMT